MEVLFIDNHLLVVNKPAGQPVQGDSSGDPDLLNEAKAFVGQKYNKPGKVFLGLVHRLDRPVSGVVALARTSKAASRLSEQFRLGTVRKEYLAIVEGRPIEGKHLVSFLKKEEQRVRQVKEGSPGAKRAQLDYELVIVMGQDALVRVYPKTGRPHQIRVQLAKDGYPILGDLKYGAKRTFDGRNLALHSLRLTLEHPVLKKPMTWSAPLPNQWPQEVRSRHEER